MNRSYSIKKMLQYSQENTCVEVSFLIKLQAFIKKRLTEKCLRTVILNNICEQLFLRVFPFMIVWMFSYMNK